MLVHRRVTPSMLVRWNLERAAWVLAQAGVIVLFSDKFHSVSLLLVLLVNPRGEVIPDTCQTKQILIMFTQLEAEWLGP